ncbi:hypothetical protein GKE82_24565 [Conexibacter sp. W3-3-2]|uniref:hypothetical protein n=1 Tax=Conexibacter sp. W3-3-2 TaxID=2675227 RepID=UPI0012B77B68|nr:hypothetical protein [Conexibacter sp. W3-3-2]MTD45587.1 hypothetical protein [Conexibacter sp. W3-3-2]MTD47118.1 hypothetical protein [Conexibacter sp. W3-3-2]MTD47382.1 hypothetical protein [Conexibacter sp. W3-3-2]
MPRLPTVRLDRPLRGCDQVVAASGDAEFEPISALALESGPRSLAVLPAPDRLDAFRCGPDSHVASLLLHAVEELALRNATTVERVLQFKSHWVFPFPASDRVLPP